LGLLAALKRRAVRYPAAASRRPARATIAWRTLRWYDGRILFEDFDAGIAYFRIALSNQYRRWHFDALFLRILTLAF